MIFIKYSDMGDILSVSSREGIERGKNILPVEKIRDDFLATFALGRYTVIGGKLVEKDSPPGFGKPPKACFFPSPVKPQTLAPTIQVLEEVAEQILEPPPKVKTAKKKAPGKPSAREKR